MRAEYCVCFSYDALELTGKQKQEFKWSYEVWMLKRLALSKRIPTNLLQTKKSTAISRLMKLATALVVLTWQIHLRYRRRKSKVSDMIRINKDFSIQESSHGTHLLEINNKCQIWTNTWVNCVIKTLRWRKLKVMNACDYVKWVTSSTTIMHLAKIFSDQFNDSIACL